MNKTVTEYQISVILGGLVLFKTEVTRCKMHAEQIFRHLDHNLDPKEGYHVKFTILNTTYEEEVKERIED